MRKKQTPPTPGTYWSDTERRYVETRDPAWNADDFNRARAEEFVADLQGRPLGRPR